MFLSNPTKEELTTLDIITLADMMVQQRRIYEQLFAEEPMSSRTSAQREFIWNIQQAIDLVAIRRGRETA